MGLFFFHDGTLSGMSSFAIKFECFDPVGHGVKHPLATGFLQNPVTVIGEPMKLSLRIVMAEVHRVAKGNEIVLCS